jgi:heat shock protein HslJ
MFIYMADAPVIALCGESAPRPVAMEGDFKALQAAYLNERPQLGEWILVSVEGRVEPRPSAEEGQPPRQTLVVQRFVGIWPGETCGNPQVDSPLRNTNWKLVRLNGAPVRVVPRQHQPYLVLGKDEQRVSGDGGCNRFTGGFELDGDRLRFRGMAGTMMACLDGMEQEGRFMQALQKVERYRISGSHLEMLDSSGAVVARFEAVAPR